MTKKPEHDDDDMPPECDFSNGVRGKYIGRFENGVRVRVLDENGNVLEKESREAEEYISRALRS